MLWQMTEEPREVQHEPQVLEGEDDLPRQPSSHVDPYTPETHARPGEQKAWKAMRFAWIPIFLFAMLFGLSMDYEVFLVTRMREAWDENRDNARAVAEGLERTGRIVTAAAIVMVAAFSGFVAGRVVGLQEFGFGLAIAIFVDATIVRALLVPSLMALFGRWNWWLPPRVARVVRVPASPLEPARRPALGSTAR